MTIFEFIIGAYCATNLFGLMFALFCWVEDVRFETFFNPFAIHDAVRVNWFGAWFLAFIAFICATPVALIFYMYKLCTVGRR